MAERGAKPCGRCTKLRKKLTVAQAELAALCTELAALRAELAKAREPWWLHRFDGSRLIAANKEVGSTVKWFGEWLWFVDPNWERGERRTSAAAQAACLRSYKRKLKEDKKWLTK